MGGARVERRVCVADRWRSDAGRGARVRGRRRARVRARERVRLGVLDVLAGGVGALARTLRGGLAREEGRVTDAPAGRVRARGARLRRERGGARAARRRLSGLCRCRLAPRRCDRAQPRRARVARCRDRARAAWRSDPRREPTSIAARRSARARGLRRPRTPPGSPVLASLRELRASAIAGSIVEDSSSLPLQGFAPQTPPRGAPITILPPSATLRCPRVSVTSSRARSRGLMTLQTWCRSRSRTATSSCSRPRIAGSAGERCSHDRRWRAGPRRWPASSLRRLAPYRTSPSRRVSLRAWARADTGVE